MLRQVRIALEVVVAPGDLWVWWGEAWEGVGRRGKLDH